ncbi:hypothetical protein KM043_018761 [Ampulex compressa]|nr:hypothetical protein KM043_018761 [Ampulex compressa]
MKIIEENFVDQEGIMNTMAGTASLTDFHGKKLYKFWARRSFTHAVSVENVQALCGASGLKDRTEKVEELN